MKGSSSDSNDQRKRKWDVGQEDPYKKDDASSIAQQAAEKINTLLAAKGAFKQATPTKEPLVDEVEINDCPGRYYLTKGTTHQEIRMLTGATVITRGTYKAPNETGGERPLYLHITADTRECIDAAIARIKQLMKGPPTQTNFGKQSNFFTTKVYIGIEVADTLSTNFNLIGKILGPKGSYIKHIASESTARVQLRGKSSGYIESPNSLNSSDDANEPLHLFISATTKAVLEKAKSLAESLVSHINEDYNVAKNKVRNTTYIPPQVQPQQPTYAAPVYSTPPPPAPYAAYAPTPPPPLPPPYGPPQPYAYYPAYPPYAHTPLQGVYDPAYAYMGYEMPEAENAAAMDPSYGYPYLPQHTAGYGPPPAMLGMPPYPLPPYPTEDPLTPKAPPTKKLRQDEETQLESKEQERPPKEETEASGSAECGSAKSHSSPPPPPPPLPPQPSEPSSKSKTTTTSGN